MMNASEAVAKRCKKGVHRNFAKFTLSKKRPWYRCFPINNTFLIFFDICIKITLSIIISTMMK